ncbi:MAG: hypothetical protein K1X89_15255, partial [Myxococcaceae bacterium]|nr:hypothetical protein [Myxococcaceae bacterium]
ELATEKQTFDVVLSRLGAGPGAFGLLSEPQKTLLASLFSLGDDAALDRQPQLTLAQLEAGLAELAARRGPVQEPAEPRPVRTEPLGLPASGPALTGEPFLQDLGLGFLWGDRLEPRKAAHAADSSRLASVLDGLALGALVVELPADAGAGPAATLDALLDALERSGHVLEVRDERLLANFGDLERTGRPVATPLWAATGLRDQEGDVFLPVPHAQLVLEVRGPWVTGQVTFYPSLDLAGAGDGGARFRPDVTADQPWCGARVAHRYVGAEARRAVALMGLMRRELDAKVRARKLPLDGYFALGVCTLAPAVVEQALEGATTLWPLTHDPALFDGDGELDRLVRALPVDGRGGPVPQLARLKGAVPFERPETVPLPELARAAARAGIWK